VDKARTLVVLIREPLILRFLQEDSAAAITIDAKRFLDRTTAETGWAGHYDWLRGSPERILGVRCWLDMLPPDSAQMVREAATSSPATEMTSDELRIWFSAARAFEDALSDDMDLGTHRVLSAEDGEVALTFDLTALTSSELRSLKGHS